MGKMQKKGSLLFDYACHPCTGTMLIFSVYLSVLLMPRSRSPGPFSKVKVNIHKGRIFSGPSFIELYHETSALAHADLQIQS